MIGKLEGNIEQSSPVDIADLTIYDTIPGTNFNGNDGTIASVTYGEAAQENLTKFHSVTVLAVVMMMPSKTLRQKLLESIESPGTLVWEAISQSAAWDVVHKYPEPLKNRLAAEGINRDALDNLYFGHTDVHTRMDHDGWDNWRMRRMKDMGLNPNTPGATKIFWDTVDLKEVKAQATRCDDAFGQYLIKGKASASAVTDALELFDGSPAKLNRFNLGRAGQLKTALPWLATTLSSFGVFYNGTVIAANIANPNPQVQVAFNAFIGNYNSLVTRVINGGAISHNDFDLLIDRFRDYMDALGLDDIVKNPIIAAMKASNDLYNP